MNPATRNINAPAYLGLECGATHSVALLVDAAGQLRKRVEGGPANLQLLSDGQLIRHFRALKQQLPVPAALAIGMAGARTAADRARIREAAARVWPRIPCAATNDLETGLMAAAAPAVADRRGPSRAQPGSAHRPALPARVLILSGTGSCCYGRAANGRTVKVGGWGHLLGDRGSGYAIGLRALQEAVQAWDTRGVWPPLGSRILRALQLNDPEDLVAWTHAADKSDIAALAVEVFAAGAHRDPLARAILADAADCLARDAAACAGRIARPPTAVQFVLAGSVLLKQSGFAARVARRVKALWAQATVFPLQRESAWGAVELALALGSDAQSQASEANRSAPTARRLPERSADNAASPGATVALAQSPTERRNPRSLHLDQLPIDRALELMLSEDAKIPRALLAQRSAIARAIQLVVRAFRRGGRLFYVGAGTSGRLGVLDASECPPTFSVSPEQVQGIIAGGPNALWQSLEGAEDDPTAGAGAIAFRRVTRKDVVVGIAASGRTPFVWGALREAKRRRAATVLLCFNPHYRIARPDRPTVVIAPNVGPEVLTGSTRLKAGTATKLVLNLISTLAMVRLGKVRSNLMIDVQASNTKLRDRAVRIMQELTGKDYPTARAALERAKWSIPRAVAVLSAQ